MDNFTLSLVNCHLPIMTPLVQDIQLQLEVTSIVKIGLGSQMLFPNSNSLYLKQGRLYKKPQFTGNDSVHWPFTLTLHVTSVYSDFMT